MTPTQDSPHPWQPPHPPTPPGSRRRRRWIAALAAALATVTGFAISWGLRPAAATRTTAGTSSAYVSLTSIESKVDPSVVDVVSVIDYGAGETAGTGIVLTSTGEILTNNHVIDGATSIKVTDVGNGKTYTAAVVGYDQSADVAVLQLQGASGLATAAIGSSSKATIGESVVALGNAGGTGGTPSAAAGTLTNLDQSITASDEATGSSEQLSGLVESSADVQAGDSGGPLVNTSGAVIAIDTAGSSATGFGAGTGESRSYAIPINQAIQIAKQIEAGHASSTIHIGTTAFLGVEFDGGANQVGLADGVEIAGVLSGSPAADAGLAAGDVITSIAGTPVQSQAALSSALVQHRPGDEVTVTWTDGAGATHSATLVLTAGPAA